MRKPIAIGAVLAALSFGSAPALAFDETPTPPPDKIEAPAKPRTPQTPPMQLGSPASPDDPQEDTESSGLFGFGLLPKLNFGLDLLYGREQQQAEPKQGETLEESEDSSLLGKIKRRF